MTADDIRKADESQRDFTGKAVKSACYAPFTSLYLTPTGGVQACCRNETFMLGNLNDQRLTEIWNGGRNHALRQALTDYNFNLGCKFCEWESARRGDSFSIRLMSDPFPVISPQPEWPAVIEFNGSNTCNLECIMCHGEYSSAIRGNRDGLPPLPKVYNDQFFDDLRQFLPHLHFINLLGGEPFLAAEVHRVWDMMLEDGLSIPCRVTTNGTQYNARIERALSAIPTHITVSLDGVTKETFETIRHRANFETVIANLHRFHAYTQGRGTNFGISFCLMRQNWRELGDMVLFAEKLDCELSILMPIGPSHCTLFTLPPHELQEIIKEIERVGAVLVPQLYRHRKAWEETVEHLRAATQVNQIQKIETVMSYFLPGNPVSTAEKLASEGHYDKALQKLEGVRQGHSDYYFALALSGYIRGRQGDMGGAAKDLENALRVSRKLPHAYLNLARIQFHQGNLDTALEYALQGKIRAVPEDRMESRLLIQLGFIYATRWRLLAACRAFARLATLPRMSHEGIALPDSFEGARRSLAEMQNETGSFRARSLAFRAYALFRLAAASHRMLVRASRFKFVRGIAGVSEADSPSPGAAMRHLLPAAPRETARWTLRVDGVNNQARLTYAASDRESVRIAIEKTGGRVSHDIQINYGRLAFRSQRKYRVTFRVRADAPRTVRFGLAKAAAPWSNLGLYRVLEVASAWQEVDEEFVSEADEPQARVHIDLGESEISFEVASLVCADLGPVVMQVTRDAT